MTTQKARGFLRGVGDVEGASRHRSVAVDPGAMSTGWHVGVDENGLGPRLGPMVVTGALVALDKPLARLVASGVTGVFRDSKVLGAHGEMSGVEALVLATLEVHLGLRPRSYEELQAMIGLQDDARLRSLCPSGASPRMCFGQPLALPAFGGVVADALRARVDDARREGFRLAAVSQGYACARVLNVERAAGRSRFDVDLALMLEIVDALRARAPGAVTAVCGKVGGRRSYAPAMTQRWPLITTLEERPANSAYRVPGVGEVAFTQDADATDPAVSLASLVGKYARELAMARIHASLASLVPGLRPVSGYHDPVTGRYVLATAAARRAEGIEDACFER